MTHLRSSERTPRSSDSPRLQALFFRFPPRRGRASTQPILIPRDATRSVFCPSFPFLFASPSLSHPLRIAASPRAPAPPPILTYRVPLHSPPLCLRAIQVLDATPEFRPRPTFPGSHGRGSRSTDSVLVSESGRGVSAEPGIQGRPWDPGEPRRSPRAGAALSLILSA